MKRTTLLTLILLHYAVLVNSQQIIKSDLKIVQTTDLEIQLAEPYIEKLNKVIEGNTIVDIPQEQRTDCSNSEIPNDEGICEECGISYYSPNTNKIIGGSVAVPGSWPAQAFIQQSYYGAWRLPDGTILSGSVSFMCGGTLITHYTIMTAAHCKTTQFLYIYGGVVYNLMIGLNSNYSTWESMFDVYLGYHNVSDMVNSYSVEKLILHQSYDSTNALNDIALFTLKKRVETNTKVQLACLPPNQSSNYPALISTVTAVGWGRTTNTGSTSNSLRNVNLIVYGSDRCVYNVAQNWNSQLCAGDFYGFYAVCNGDSGSGLYYKDIIGNKTKYIVVGMPSYGRATGCTDAPSVFTRVSYFVTWIKANWKIVVNESSTTIASSSFTTLQSVTNSTLFTTDDNSLNSTILPHTTTFELQSTDTTASDSSTLEFTTPESSTDINYFSTASTNSLANTTISPSSTSTTLSSTISVTTTTSTLLSTIEATTVTITSTSSVYTNNPLSSSSSSSSSSSTSSAVSSTSIISSTATTTSRTISTTKETSSDSTLISSITPFSTLLPITSISSSSSTRATTSMISTTTSSANTTTMSSTSNVSETSSQSLTESTTTAGTTQSINTETFTNPISSSSRRPISTTYTAFSSANKVHIFNNFVFILVFLSIRNL